jgi:fructose-1,6-bisphosphatase I
LSVTPVTIQRHIIEQMRRHPHASGDFSKLLNDLCLSAKIISYQVNKAGLLNILGIAGSENVHGETQKKLDVFAHDVLVRTLQAGGHLCVMGSEEDEDPIAIPKEYQWGKYTILFDPLDGSSNIDANVSVGTIFSIYHRVTPEGTRGRMEDLLQPGYKQIAAGYVVYGSSTMLVFTTGQGVHGFTLDPSYGEFVLSHPNIQLPKKGKIYSVNESYFDYWDKEIQGYIQYVKQVDPDTNRPLNSRYIGSLVADFHRNLLYGGIFLYPGDSSKPSRKGGKLRLMYEANPMAFICEQAGGLASTGQQRILEVVPESLHQRVPLIIGSEDDVKMALSFTEGKLQ